MISCIVFVYFFTEISDREKDFFRWVCLPVGLVEYVQAFTYISKTKPIPQAKLCYGPTNAPLS